MRQSKVVVWKAKDGWRWRAVAANGRIVGESAEAYKGLRKALAGLEACWCALQGPTCVEAVAKGRKP